MNILITGGTGFIGTTLCNWLKNQGETLWVLTRQSIPSTPKQYFIQDLAEIKKEQVFHAVINLAGEPIAQRWTMTRKDLIRQSRIELTHKLINTLQRLTTKPKVLLSGSAIGFYGPQDDTILTETSAFEPSFSHQLCQEWENAANQIAMDMRVCCLRTGVVLGHGGGMLSKMRLPFLCGLGGPIGAGNQWISWIHLHDLIRSIDFILKDVALSGPINMTAPNPVTHETFAKTYAKVLHRPSFLRTPTPVIKIAMGEMGQELLLSGQRVIPQKLIAQGFTFTYPILENALKALESTK